jgi:hypothetical protein
MQWALIIIKLENFLLTFYMNCNAKKELSQHISTSRTLYVKEPHVAREPRFGHPRSIESVDLVTDVGPLNAMYVCNDMI